ncbi:MFS transporter [Marmoricola endophyticus]|uniref:MFS transporter n=1 Tax=Marmoricola endophyticus TaxID=2040280 RepID=A0A917BBJ1_9ACTN|nr:oligopeptide:H+ symporter [Marmoricola endophyticus]GGF35557.1 MFS transporter [Marmoricola endophyticus]
MTTTPDPTPDPAEPGTTSTSVADRDHRFFGQPLVLANLFGVELWERFSFYGMQGILLIYLYFSVADGGLGIDRGVAAGIGGAYGGSVYLATILGAWAADRLIGPERTLFYSAVTVMIGHLALSLVPGLGGVGVGLVLIALGSGGVKANATSLVGSLYDERDSRRDAGFSLFYMGINIGALVGPLLTGVLQKDWGFHAGFGLAAIGMAVGLVQYAVGRRSLPASTQVVPDPLPSAQRWRWGLGGLVAVVVVALLAVLGVITAQNLDDIVITVVGIAAVGYFVLILADRAITRVERRRTWALVPLLVSNAVFWALFQQQFTVVTIYSDLRLDRDLFGWTMPISWVQSIEPFFVVVFAGAFAALWTRLGDRQPSTPVKFAAGTALMGVAFLLFLLLPPGENTAPVLGLTGVLLVFCWAELLISPVGLSMATKLAAAKYHTQTIALYFLSIALGTALAGKLGSYYDPTDEGGYFLVLGLVAVVVGALVLAAYRPILRLMEGVR